MIHETDPLLYGLNLGDSGYMIVRKKEDQGHDLIFRTTEQQHKFNHPYQCGTNYKLPYAAQDLKHEVKENDVVIMASDGLFDNLTD